MEARAGHGKEKATEFITTPNDFIPIKQLHLFGLGPLSTRSNLRDSISRDLAYIPLHLLDANPETHEHWVFATLSRHKGGNGEDA